KTAGAGGAESGRADAGRRIVRGRRAGSLHREIDPFPARGAVRAGAVRCRAALIFSCTTPSVAALVGRVATRLRRGWRDSLRYSRPTHWFVGIRADLQVGLSVAKPNARA